MSTLRDWSAGLGGFTQGIQSGLNLHGTVDTLRQRRQQQEMTRFTESYQALASGNKSWAMDRINQGLPPTDRVADMMIDPDTGDWTLYPQASERQPQTVKFEQIAPMIPGFSNVLQQRARLQAQYGGRGQQEDTTGQTEEERRASLTGGGMRDYYNNRVFGLQQQLAAARDAGQPTGAIERQLEEARAAREYWEDRIYATMGAERSNVLAGPVDQARAVRRARAAGALEASAAQTDMTAFPQGDRGLLAGGGIRGMAAQQAPMEPAPVTPETRHLDVNQSGMIEPDEELYNRYKTVLTQLDAGDTRLVGALQLDQSALAEMRAFVKQFEARLNMRAKGRLGMMQGR
jgi:hypothetical protein